MHILLLSSAYNSLTQHAHIELKALGHSVGIAVGTTGDAMREAVRRFQPDLVLCPMQAQVIPRDIWEQHTCIILHPGIVGDRGANSLDWAILNEEQEWGVTAVQAAEHVDSGPIWATYEFKMRAASKSSLYRDEVSRAAVKAMLVAVRRFESGLFVPAPLDYSQMNVRGRYRPFVKTEERQSTGKAIRSPRSSEKSVPATGLPACWMRSADARSTSTARIEKAPWSANPDKSSRSGTAPFAGRRWMERSGSPT